MRRGFDAAFRRPAIRLAAPTLRALPISSERFGPPRGVADSRDARREALGIRRVDLAPADRLPLLDPLLLERNASFFDLYCIGTRERSVTRIDGRMYCERRAKYVSTIPGGRVVGCDGAIIAPDDRILADLSPEFDSERRKPGQHSLLTRIKLPPPRQLGGCVAVLASLGSGFFAHWMMDLVPRVGLLRAGGVDLDAVDWFYLPSPRTRSEREALEAAQIPLAKIVDCATNPHVRAETLIVPSPLSEVFQASRWSCDYLNELFTHDEGDPSLPRLVYVSRRNVGHRKIANESALLATLDDRGFVVVEPQDLTLREQARLFAAADTVVLQTGSAVAGLVYCRPGTAIVEIQNRGAVQTCALAIASERGLRYALVVADGVDTTTPPLYADVMVDVPIVARTLDVLAQRRPPS